MNSKFHPSEPFFLIAGVGTLVATAFLFEGIGFGAWIVAKSAYALGVIFLLFNH